MLLKEMKSADIAKPAPAPSLEELTKFRMRRNAGGTLWLLLRGSTLCTCSAARMHTRIHAHMHTRARAHTDADEDDVDRAPMADAEKALLETIAATRASNAVAASQLRPGDSVVIVKGELMNMTGTVVSVNGSTFTMRPSLKFAQEFGLSDDLEMPCEEVRGCGRACARARPPVVLSPPNDTRVACCARRMAWACRQSRRSRWATT